jgi:hypothetical protein
LNLPYFDPEQREVVLHQEDSQERYEWLNSYKTLYATGPGLWMNLRNEVLATVRRQLSITVEGLDTISLSVEGCRVLERSVSAHDAGNPGRGCSSADGRTARIRS